MLNQNPEQLARDEIDRQLLACGWVVQHKKEINLSASQGVAVREYQTDIGPADYVLFVDKKPVGIIEAKRAEEGVHLTMHEDQTEGYATVYTDDDKIEKYLLKKDDVLFNKTNSAELVGKNAIYKGERPAIFAGYLIRINRIEELLDAKYITDYLNTIETKKYDNSIRSIGVNQSNIIGTKLKSYPIPLPPLKEQEQIVQEIESRLSVADKMEESISQSIQQAEALRQSILKKVFEGRLINHA